MRMQGREFDGRTTNGRGTHRYPFTHHFGERRGVITEQGVVDFRFAYAVVDDPTIRRNVLARFDEGNRRAILQLVCGNNIEKLGEDMRAARREIGSPEAGLRIIERVRKDIVANRQFSTEMFTGIVRNMSLLALAHVLTKTAPSSPTADRPAFLIDHDDVFPHFLPVAQLYGEEIHNPLRSMHDQLHGFVHGARPRTQQG